MPKLPNCAASILISSSSSCFLLVFSDPLDSSLLFFLKVSRLVLQWVREKNEINLKRCLSEFSRMDERDLSGRFSPWLSLIHPSTPPPPPFIIMPTVNVSARAPQPGRGEELGDYRGRALTQSVISAAAGRRRCVRQAADDAAQCCYTPQAVFGNTEAARRYGPGQ